MTSEPWEIGNHRRHDIVIIFIQKFRNRKCDLSYTKQEKLIKTEYWTFGKENEHTQSE